MFDLFRPKKIVEVSKGETSNLIREDISKRLEAEHLNFIEEDSRMNYGMIGRIFCNNKLGITLFGDTFYVYSGDIPMNRKNIELIRDIQKEFAELSRDSKGRITSDPKKVYGKQ